MTSLFIDVNIPMYATGRDHPLKQPCVQTLQLVARRREAFITDAEVLQEMLHRYTSLRRWPQAEEDFRRFAELLRDRVEPINAADVEEAATSVVLYADLSTRDLIHLAVRRRLEVDGVVSADKDFDRVPGLRRLDPADLEEWRGEIES